MRRASQCTGCERRPLPAAGAAARVRGRVCAADGRRRHPRLHRRRRPAAQRARRRRRVLPLRRRQGALGAPPCRGAAGAARRGGAHCKPTHCAVLPLGPCKPAEQRHADRRRSALGAAAERLFPQVPTSTCRVRRCMQRLGPSAASGASAGCLSAGVHRHRGGGRRGGVPALRRAHRRERHRADIVGALPVARPPACCAGGGAWTFALATRRPCRSACRFPSSLSHCAPCAGVHPPARVKRVHSDCALVFRAQLAWGLCRSRRRWQRRCFSGRLAAALPPRDPPDRRAGGARRRTARRRWSSPSTRAASGSRTRPTRRGRPPPPPTLARTARRTAGGRCSPRCGCARCGWAASCIQTSHATQTCCRALLVTKPYSTAHVGDCLMAGAGRAQAWGSCWASAPCPRARPEPSGALTARRPGRGAQCTVRGGREGRDIDAVELARAVEALGAGEILLNCIDTDGQCAAPPAQHPARNPAHHGFDQDTHGRGGPARRALRQYRRSPAVPHAVHGKGTRAARGPSGSQMLSVSRARHAPLLTVTVAVRDSGPDLELRRATAPVHA